jgi:hypothetical protein
VKPVDDEDQWFGVFQGYRPDGDGVEELFAGLPDAADYAERLRTVYRAARHADWAQDAYFVVRTPRPATDEEVVALGQELLDGLRLIADLGTRFGRGDLHEYLSRVRGAVVVRPDTLDRQHNEQLLVNESVGDILHGFYDHGHRIIRLQEGYFSVACDYWLAWYLMWPYFREWVPRDVFRPYFELWARGCDVAFQGQCLRLAKADAA